MIKDPSLFEFCFKINVTKKKENRIQATYKESRGNETKKNILHDENIYYYHQLTKIPSATQ